MDVPLTVDGEVTGRVLGVIVEGPDARGAVSITVEGMVSGVLVRNAEAAETDVDQPGGRGA